MTGKSKKKTINGIEFDAETPDEVVWILLRYMHQDQRIRLFYGDSKTGKDWAEKWDVMGRVGCSIGPVKIPLLIPNSTSTGGSGILTGCIVRITVNKQNIYIHPKYHLNITVRENKVYKDGTVYAVCQSNEKARKLAEFLKGNTNVRG